MPRAASVRDAASPSRSLAAAFWSRRLCLQRVPQFARERFALRLARFAVELLTRRPAADARCVSASSFAARDDVRQRGDPPRTWVIATSNWIRDRPAMAETTSAPMPRNCSSKASVRRRGRLIAMRPSDFGGMLFAPSLSRRRRGRRCVRAWSSNHHPRVDLLLQKRRQDAFSWEASAPDLVIACDEMSLTTTGDCAPYGRDETVAAPPHGDRELIPELNDATSRFASG